MPVLPAGQDPLRILHISDLHLTPGQRSKVDWVRDLASLDPHLVVNTGDNWAHLDAMPALLEALEPHLAMPGAFVLGSNDYIAPTPKNPARYLLPDARRAARHAPAELPWRELTARFRSAGWMDLTNRRDVVKADGRVLSLVGTDDAHLDRDRFPAPAATTTPAPGRPGGPAPRRHARAVPPGARRDARRRRRPGDRRAHARRSAALPFWGALVTNCDLDTGRAKGLHGWPGPRPDRPGGAGSTWLHVSAGLGTSPYAPVRFACRPEATLLTLVARLIRFRRSRGRRLSWPGSTGCGAAW